MSKKIIIYSSLTGNTAKVANAIAEEIMTTYAGDIVDIDDLKPVYGLNDSEAEYVYNYINERC